MAGWVGVDNGGSVRMWGDGADMGGLAARPGPQGLSPGEAVLSAFPALLQSLCLWAARGGMLFGFRASNGAFVFNPFRFNGDVPFPRRILGVLGRSQQQGKNNH